MNMNWIYLKSWIIHPDGKRNLLYHFGTNLDRYSRESAFDCALADQEIWKSGLSRMGFNPDDFKFEIEETTEEPPHAS